MTSKGATPGRGRDDLVALLRELSHDRGVQREDLVVLLHGKLRKLAQCWTLNLNDSDSLVRRRIADALHEHVRNLYPRWGERLITDRGEVARHRRIVAVGFNISEYAEVSQKALKARWEWLDKEADRALRVPIGTSRRIFREAITEIAERMINAGAAIGAPAKPEDTLLPSPPQPAPRAGSFFPDLVGLSGELKHALDGARDACEGQNRVFYTSDLLVALFDLPSGRAAGCFDEVRGGLSANIRKQLAATLDPGQQHEPYVPFDWEERPDVQLAARYAVADGRPFMSDLHVLLAILNGESETNRWLQRHLGKEHDRVREVAERRRRLPPTRVKTPTPDGRR